MLTSMCEKFSQSPSDYLSNDPMDAHSRLAIDMTIFNVWAEYMEEDRKRRERQSKLDRKP